MLIRDVSRFVVISFLLFFQCVSSSFAASAPVPNEQVRRSDDLGQSSAATVQAYDELVKAIRATRQESQQRIEQSKVREAWETGKLIDEHVLLHKERAEYGARVIERLAKDLGSSATELGYMLKFARMYPIAPTSGELTWSDYRELLSLKDSAKRTEVSEKAAREKWDTKRIRSEVKRINQLTQTGTEPSERLSAKPGILHAYRVVAGLEDGERVLDLGFSNYYKPVEKITFQPDDILEVVWGAPNPNGLVQSRKELDVPVRSGEYKKLKDAGEDVLYTYKIEVLDIIDGDTIKAVIDLGFGFRTVQTLRLRGIDAPELPTADGKAAKEFLEKLLAPSSKVLIRTVKSDKYDRYLADIFMTDEKGKEQYLNNLLLEKGYAVRVSE